MATVDRGLEGGVYETRADAVKGKDQKGRDAALVRMWLETIDLAGKEEKDWRQAASKVYGIYKDASTRTDKQFNILYSNIQTLVPAIYSSQPTPDVRRRYGDKDDAGRVVSQIIERALSYAMDQYDFDNQLRSAVITNEIVGRAVNRVRYVPYFSKAEKEPGEAIETPAEESAEHQNSQEPVEPGEVVSYEEVRCETVNWENFRHGPARTWDDVNWVAFELFLTREQLESISEEYGSKVNLDSYVNGFDEKQWTGPPPEIFKRARVWEIWDKERREVLFIAEGFKEAPLKVQPDPLGLRQFFPIPRPLYAVTTPDSLVPIEPYRYYKDQAEELDSVTRRIGKLVRVMKFRGFYPGSAEAAGAMTQLSDANDGEMIPVSDFQSFVGSGGGLDKAFWMMPIDIVSGVIEKLYVNREQIKQTIYEITGVSDILRGNTDPNETLGAQEIKANFGNKRLVEKQKEVQRYARDLLRLKAELMAEKFSVETLELMTGIRLLPKDMKDQMAAQAQAGAQLSDEQQEQLKAPSREEISELLRNDILRQYRIDIETDSTLRGDLQAYQQTMNQFLQGTAAFMQAVGPMVLEGTMPKSMAVKLYAPYARQFNLGKATEDAIEEFIGLAEKADKQPKPPGPEQMKLQADMQRAQIEGKNAQEKHQMELQTMQADVQVKQTMAQMDMAIAQEKMGIEREKMQLEREKMAMEREQMGVKLAIDRESMKLKGQQLAMQGEAAERSHELDMEATQVKHQTGLEMMAAKAKQAKVRPEARA